MQGPEPTNLSAWRWKLLDKAFLSCEGEFKGALDGRQLLVVEGSCMSLSPGVYSQVTWHPNSMHATRCDVDRHVISAQCPHHHHQHHTLSTSPLLPVASTFRRGARENNDLKVGFVILKLTSKSLIFRFFYHCFSSLSVFFKKKKNFWIVLSILLIFFMSVIFSPKGSGRFCPTSIFIYFFQNVFHPVLAFLFFLCVFSFFDFF